MVQPFFFISNKNQSFFFQKVASASIWRKVAPFDNFTNKMIMLVNLWYYPLFKKIKFIIEKQIDKPEDDIDEPMYNAHS